MKFGKPEKLGGWKQICQTALKGVCRALHWWTDLSDLSYLSAGTDTQLGVITITNRVLSDITPAGLPPGLASSTPDQPYSLRIWSLDNFGQNLIAVPSGGALYAWIPPDVAIPAVFVPQAPPHNQGAFVAMPQQIVVAFGSSPDAGTRTDPLLLRWCDQSNYADWTPSTTNQAGSFRLPRGSRIVGALQEPLTALIWTDLDLWVMTYMGFPLVFSITQVSSLCGLIAQKARCVLGSVPYWMSQHGFFRLGVNGAEQIVCPVWDVVFKDIDQANQDKCLTATVFAYSEIFFFYPSKSGGTGEIDSYVKYNVQENLWDYGKLIRTAWTDENGPAAGLPDGPLGADLDGLVQQHESGLDANGVAMTGVLIRSAYMDLADGHEQMVANRFIPDFLWQGADPKLMVKLLFRNFPGETPTVAGPFEITPQTQYVTVGTLTPIPVLGVRAREIAIEIDCDAVDTWFRMGTPRLRTAQDGTAP